MWYTEGIIKMHEVQAVTDTYQARATSAILTW